MPFEAVQACISAAAGLASPLQVLMDTLHMPLAHAAATVAPFAAAFDWAVPLALALLLQAFLVGAHSRQHGR